MLNRRYLRVKVMQALYSYELAKAANYQVGQDLIREAFVPDWDEKPNADYVQLSEDSQSSLDIFSELYLLPEAHLKPGDHSAPIQNAVNQALHFYQKQLTRDKNTIEKNLSRQVDQIYEIYLSILLFLTELSEQSRLEKDREPQYLLDQAPQRFNLGKNQLAKALTENRYFVSEISRRDIHWRNHKQIINEIYRKVLKTDAQYQEYEQIEHTDFDADKDILNYFVKKIIFGRKNLVHFFVSEIYLDPILLNKYLKEFSSLDIFNKIQEGVYELVEVFLEKIERNDLDQTALTKTLQSRLEKMLKEVYEDIPEAVSGQLGKSNASKSRASKILETDLGNAPLLSQKIIEQSIKEIVTFFSIQMDKLEENHVDNQSQLLKLMNHLIEVFFSRLQIEWTESTRITIKVDTPKKYSSISDRFAEMDLNWSENAKIVQSMVQNTLKNIEIGKHEEMDLVPLSKNWEEDQLFFLDLYRKNILEDQRYEEIISGKSRNWDLSRLALIDKIILKMAICEMIHFYSIPVKVSINEYIELSKIYSTLKSKQFINGLLDAISQDLINRRVIKKSGRGLMDNK